MAFSFFNSFVPVPMALMEREEKGKMRGRRLWCIILCLVVFFTCFHIQPAAAREEYRIGDVDGNGSVDSQDALLVLQSLVGAYSLTAVQQKAADVEGNGEISSVSALCILQFSVGILYRFEAEPPFDTSKAYKQDETADCSFQITTEGLVENTVYCLQNSLFESDDPFYTADFIRFAVSLQGLINRDYGMTHTALVYLMVDGKDQAWYEYMAGEGKMLQNARVVSIGTAQEFFQIFRSQINHCGIILWDSAVPATANVAATICGVDGYLPVQYDPSLESFYQTILEYEIPQKQSLVGMFSGQAGSKIPDTRLNSSGSAKCDAYLWAMEHYMDRCTSNYIIYTLDGAGCVKGNPLQQPSAKDNCLYNHDYYIARRGFFFDLTCFNGEAPCDDLNQPLGADADTLHKLLLRRYENANGAFGQILGFPPWWMKYTTHLNRGSLQPTSLEWIYVEIATSYNLAKEADAAHPCWMSNGSAYYKYKSTVERFVSNRPAKKQTFDESVCYFTFYVGDYDSSAWLKTHVANFWMNKNRRGEFPLMWAFNPNLSNRVPMVFDYVYENKTPNDYFTAGDSGAGYVIPALLFQESTARTLPDAGEKWKKYCLPYYEKFDLDITGFIINGYNRMSPKIMDVFNRLSKTGSFHNDSNLPLVSYKGVPYMYLNNGVSGSESSLQDSVRGMYTHFRSKMKGTNFAGFRTVVNSPDEMYNLQKAFVEYANAKENGFTYEYTDSYTLFDLVEQSGQTVPIMQ